MKELITVRGVDVKTRVSHSLHHEYTDAMRLDKDITLTRIDLGCRGEVFKYEVVAHIETDDGGYPEYLYRGASKTKAWDALLND